MSVKNLLDSEKAESPPQLPRYCSKVRMGNWQEELMQQEENIKYYLKKKNRGELLVQKTQATFANVLKEVKLLSSSHSVSFGQRCQVRNASRGLRLVAVAGVGDVDTVQHFRDGSVVGATPPGPPTVRTCFTVVRMKDICRKGDPLNYGEPFSLAISESPLDELLVECEVPHLHSALGRCRRPLLRLTAFPNISCLWRALPLHPDDRDALKDTPLQAGVPIIIRHVASNTNLCLEPDFWFSTYFGMECEVSVHTDLNVYRRETDNNIWMLINNNTDTYKSSASASS